MLTNNAKIYITIYQSAAKFNRVHRLIVGYNMRNLLYSKCVLSYLYINYDKDIVKYIAKLYYV